MADAIIGDGVDAVVTTREDILRDQEATAIKLAGSLVIDVAHNMPYESERRAWLNQCGPELLREGFRLREALDRKSAPVLRLNPESASSRFLAAGIKTIPEAIELIAHRGGLQWVPGIGPARERQLFAAIALWEAEA